MRKSLTFFRDTLFEKQLYHIFVQFLANFWNCLGCNKFHNLPDCFYYETKINLSRIFTMHKSQAKFYNRNISTIYMQHCNFDISAVRCKSNFTWMRYLFSMSHFFLLISKSKGSSITPKVLVGLNAAGTVVNQGSSFLNGRSLKITRIVPLSN